MRIIKKILIFIGVIIMVYFPGIIQSGYFILKEKFPPSPLLVIFLLVLMEIFVMIFAFIKIKPSRRSDQS